MICSFYFVMCASNAISNHHRVLLEQFCVFFGRSGGNFPSAAQNEGCNFIDDVLQRHGSLLLTYAGHDSLTPDSVLYRWEWLSAYLGRVKSGEQYYTCYQSITTNLCKTAPLLFS